MVWKRLIKSVALLLPPIKRLTRERDLLADQLGDLERTGSEQLLKQARLVHRIDEELVRTPKPWFTSGAIAWLENEINKTMVILEYGGGYSSLWWCDRVKVVYTVEASIEWISLLSLEFYRRPDLLAKWRLCYSPCEWYSSYKQPKKYWQENGKHLTCGDVESMEQDYLFQPMANVDVLVIDGSIRPQTLRHVPKLLEQNNIKIIVVDNTESQELLDLASAVIPSTFEQINFPATSVDNIPPWQNGQWMTTVWKRGNII